MIIQNVFTEFKFANLLILSISDVSFLNILSFYYGGIFNTSVENKGLGKAMRWNNSCHAFGHFTKTVNQLFTIKG